MKQSWKEKANKVLSRMGEHLPTSGICFGCWGEVELPECLRAELENSESMQENK